MNLNQRTELFCRAVTQELIRIRKESGFSQNQLGPAAGLDQSTINLMESGKTTPTIATLFRLSDTMGKSPALVLKKAMEALPAKGPILMKYPDSSGEEAPAGLVAEEKPPQKRVRRRGRKEGL